MPTKAQFSFCLNMLHLNATVDADKQVGKARFKRLASQEHVAVTSKSAKLALKDLRLKNT